MALPADLSDEGDVQRVLTEAQEQAGPVDVLINNAGVGDQALFDQADWPRTRQLLLTNVLAPVQLCSALVPAMISRGRGGVLNIGSGAGLTVIPAAAAYAASKRFVDGFTEALRADLAGTGVVVTQVCPGPVDSEFDTVAGSVGGMTGTPPQFMRISAARCAAEALAGFDRGAPMVFPGRSYRIAMRALPLVPRGMQRRQAAQSAARVRHAAPGAGDGRTGMAKTTRTSRPAPARAIRTSRPARHRLEPSGQDGRSDREMRISRLVLTGAAIGTIIGTGRADLNRTHVFNPAWPPHARFHGAAGWGTVACSQLLAVWLLWRPSLLAADRDLAVATAALLPPIAWAPFFFALPLPGTAVEDDPGHLPRVAGVPANLVPATLIPALCALGYALHRRGQ